MASHFQIQKPYVLASLPRPLDPTTGRYVVSEVYGSEPGSRKRKRHELAVGVDGEAVNIYNVSSARLVTSYPIPPQSLFSCPLSSIRRKAQGSNEILRYTYAAIRENDVCKITLFKDYVDAAGKTTSTTKSLSLGPGQPAIYLGPLLIPAARGNTSPQASGEELIIVRQNGEIVCLDVESLETKWISSPTALHQDLPGPAKSTFTIDFCCPALLSQVIQGISRGSNDVFGRFPEVKQSNGADPEVLVLVSSYGSSGQLNRHLHIIGMLPPSYDSMRTRQGIIQLHAVPIASPQQGEPDTISYRLDVRSGSLLELRNQTLSVYDITASIPKIASSMDLEGASTFLRLSRTSVLCSTPFQLSIYNPVYRSLQNTVPIDLDATDTPTCSLVAYFSRLELAIAIADSNLVGIQLEAPSMRTQKRRAEGLLIDSIGRGVRLAKRHSSHVTNPVPERSMFSNYLPGSIRGNYWQTWTAEESKADALLNANDIDGLERLLAEKFGIQVNNVHQINGTNGDEQIRVTATTNWKWPKNRLGYPPADRRWILYAISRAFQWNDTLLPDTTIPRLICQLPQSDIVNYLVDAGHLTLSNIKSAFRGKLREAEQVDSFLAEQLVLRLADLDPSLELLVTYIAATNLGAAELLVAVRTIMRSLELVHDPKQPPPKLLTNGAIEETMNATGVADENIGMELDDLENEIQKTISYLNEDAGIRGNGLSVAFAKLGSCPGISMIKALRTVFEPEEILSLVYLLRVELVKGAWTSRYLDVTEFEKDKTLVAPPDSIIKLIADMLGRCVDSIGPGGWLLNDALLADDESGDFVASLKLEVSAALEGLEEVVYLRGIVGEAVKYCESLRKTRSETAVDMMKPISLHVKEPGDRALPLGLKTRGRISAQKIVSGGEVVERSQRETGHLRSQQVGNYSLERIAI
ncbi:hypothetical protein F4779DRAFT_630228 [Xylariaceae sp. FL0662B]|nr:hypothetical protein F4779DRAFT_630228 [Xylariaceae sp. FL0662B]